MQQREHEQEHNENEDNEDTLTVATSGNDGLPFSLSASTKVQLAQLLLAQFPKDRECILLLALSKATAIWVGHQSN